MQNLIKAALITFIIALAAPVTAQEFEAEFCNVNADNPLSEESVSCR